MFINDSTVIDAAGGSNFGHWGAGGVARELDLLTLALLACSLLIFCHPFYLSAYSLSFRSL